MKVPCRALPLLIAFSTFAVSAARADSLLPLRTEEAATLASGRAEIVLGTSFFEDERFPAFTVPGALRSQHRVTAPEIGLRVAAGSWVEIQAAFEMIYLDETTRTGDSDTHYGNGDARLATKVRLLRETDRRPALGLRFETKLPNASRKKRLGTDETDFGIAALGSKELGWLALHLNLGILLLGNPGPLLGDPDDTGSGQDDLFTYNVALTTRPVALREGSAVTGRLLAEVVGLAGSRFDNDRTSFRLGAQLGHGALLGYAGASAGLSGGSEDFGISAGVLYSFELERLVAAFD